jgi:hypothetical protein
MLFSLAAISPFLPVCAFHAVLFYGILMLSPCAACPEWCIGSAFVLLSGLLVGLGAAKNAPLLGMAASLSVATLQVLIASECGAEPGPLGPDAARAGQILAGHLSASLCVALNCLFLP